MKNLIKILCLAIVALGASALRAEEKGFPMYSQEKRDVALVLSDRISSSDTNTFEMKRIVYREVPVEIKTRVDDLMESTSMESAPKTTHALFEVRRDRSLVKAEPAQSRSLARLDVGSHAE